MRAATIRGQLLFLSQSSMCGYYSRAATNRGVASIRINTVKDNEWFYKGWGNLASSLKSWYWRYEAIYPVSDDGFFLSHKGFRAALVRRKSAVVSAVRGWVRLEATKLLKLALPIVSWHWFSINCFVCIMTIFGLLLSNSTSVGDLLRGWEWRNFLLCPEDDLISPPRASEVYIVLKHVWYLLPAIWWFCIESQPICIN